MSEKSFVGLENALCPVCGQKHATGVLIHKRMAKVFDHGGVTTHWEMCEEHKKLFKDGYVALVGTDPKLSVIGSNGNMQQDGAHRTGRIAHLRFAAFEQIFGNEPPKGGMCFVEDEVITKLEQMQKG